MTNISFKEVNKSYLPEAKIWAVKNYTLEINQEEFFCLVGPSGCGKSTILKMIADLEEPTSGLVIKPSNISMVFQSGALFPWLSVEENVSIGLKMNGANEAVTKEITQENIDLVGLKTFADKYPRDLSGGQRQRVGIARALSVSPEVLLLDEPFSALDPLTTQELHQDLLKIWKEKKVTIVMVSHLLEEAVLLADRVGVMKEGTLKKVIEVPLKRPREEFSPKTIKLVKEIRQILYQAS